ncbi:GNAT family N-acetyltransferase [Oceaniovalibus sp. ACAM 378]|uniref:GNAT family N-acetyltransferase n=1 Tax=Oceaniovalibus sp. ACAM 378 TaxID=2599923 RepID=UPI0011D965F8|nr:GNAT family protein [Oceaniovalibus sp. ACAM 378]TYB86068.1 GNAT family N-acetyltransferase [Oceaniovalibus sp. ACAM 378]
MLISTPRIILRDFELADQSAFVGYQMDPRYLRLYDLEEDLDRARSLFNLFMDWQSEVHRRNFQLGIFDTITDRLIGCAGLRVRLEDPGTAVVGIELAPSDWGRYRVALDAAACLVEFGFDSLNLDQVVGETASGNERVEKISRWFGAQIVAEREGPRWMDARGWHEVVWALTRADWQRSQRRQWFNQSWHQHHIVTVNSVADHGDA